MSDAWPLLGPFHTIEGFVEPMEWGRATYTVIRVPDDLVDADDRWGPDESRARSRDARSTSL